MTRKIIIVAVLLVLAALLHISQYQWGIFERDPSIRLYTVTEEVPNEVAPEYYGLQPFGGQVHRGYVLGLFLPFCFLAGAFFMVGVGKTRQGALYLTSIGYGSLAFVAAAIGAVLVLRI